MKLYLYCLAEGHFELQDDVSGLDNAKIEILEKGNLSVFFSRFDEAVVPVSRQNVVQHEKVVRKVFSTATVLPFRFGALVTEADLDSYLQSRQHALLQRLAMVRDCVEMSVKIIWQNSSNSELTEPATENDAELGVGTTFLRQKRQELLGSERLDADARELAAWLRRELAPVVSQEQITLEPKQRLVVAASYLVEKRHVPDYRRELARLQAQRQELHFLTSGPWPPYTFANVDLEFETHFGVI